MKILKFGLDYVTLLVRNNEHFHRFDSHFLGLSDNSPHSRVFFYECEFMVHYSKTADKDLLTYHFGVTPVFQVQRIIRGGAQSKYSHYVKFYGSFFQIPALSHFLRYLTIEYRNLSVSRVDLALDVDLSVSEVLDFGYNTRLHGGAEFYDRNGLIETKYFGRRKNNKKHFFRLYNKLADTETKSKLEFYLPYFEYENVTRLELECHSESCKRYRVDVDFLFDDYRQLELFKSLANNSATSNFLFLDDCALVGLPDVVEPVKAVMRQSMVNISRSRTMFLAYARNLYREGFCPFDVLVEEVSGFVENDLTDSGGTDDGGASDLEF